MHPDELIAVRTLLPIAPALPGLHAALAARGVAVLQAPPGAGKTTGVPPSLLGAAWLGDRKILMLEPRRIAARAAARYMASRLGEDVGGTVGYRVRMDSRVGPRTRIEVITEGVLTRMLQTDPTLDGIGIVIFDEYHERSLHADLGLALTLHTRALLREDLRVLVMSATLDGAPVAALIGDGEPAPIITSEGRAYPVETRHVARRPDTMLEPQVVALVVRAMTESSGDLLVFLPGAAEIARVLQALSTRVIGTGTYIAPLHGSLDQAAQDRAIAPSVPGERKVVLATTIAQTSLTIEGIRIVIDSGLLRAPRFSPRTGMTRLETVRVSRASAEQRCGRAGRVAPGICYRMWDAHEQQGLIAFDRPEILEADLAPLALELAAAGIHGVEALRWLDAPPAASVAQARELLAQLGALDANGRCTTHGREMARLGAHPRIAHMLLRALDLGADAAVIACDVAALLGQRDILRYPGGDGASVADVDLRVRLEVLRALDATRGRAAVHGASVDQGLARQALLESREWRRALGVHSVADTGNTDIAGLLVAFAYPERIAQRRAAAGAGVVRYVLRSGAGAELRGAQSLGDAPCLAIAELGGAGDTPRIFSAAPLPVRDLEAHFGSHIVREQLVTWQSEFRRVHARERSRLGAIVLRDGPLRNPDPDAVLTAMLTGIRQDGLAVLPWSDGATALRERMAFAHAVDDAWPDVSDDALMATLETWLGPNATAATVRGSLEGVDVAAALRSTMTWERQQSLERFAPTHVAVPSGSRIRVDYSAASGPVLAVRLQEVFGMQDTPRIADGRVPLTVHLLSPAHRPVQVTRDLAGFWRTSYFDVKKEMKGRYPKHYWPDDPLAAAPRRGSKRP